MELDDEVQVPRAQAAVPVQVEQGPVCSIFRFRENFPGSFYQNITRKESPKDRDKREVINKEIEDYLTRFGYLPQSDLETGALRTMQQLKDAIRSVSTYFAPHFSQTAPELV